MSSLSPQICLIRIHPDLKNVKIEFDRKFGDSEQEESKGDTDEYGIKSTRRPHKDFVSAMKKLRKFALELLEVEVDSKQIGNWTVSEVHISGDVAMRQSRVQFRLAKSVERTGKVVELAKTGQVVMYPMKDQADSYQNAETMSKHVETVIDEAVKYLNGKYESEDNKKNALFNFEQLELSFVK